MTVADVYLYSVLNELRTSHELIFLEIEFEFKPFIKEFERILNDKKFRN